MNFTNWNRQEYKIFITYLKSLEDKKYKDFSLKITMQDDMIGICIPTLKKIAKEISNGNFIDFLKLNKCSFYEEKMLYGLVLGYAKTNFNTVLSYFDAYISCIDNWAICDTVCANMKCFLKNLDDGYLFIKKCVDSNEVFRIRVGLVLLLTYYLNANYINNVLEISKSIRSSQYYVKMANAWLISYCYIKFPSKTLAFLKENNIDNWTHNKAIQKCIESHRIDKKDKEQLKKLKK